MMEARSPFTHERLQAYSAAVECYKSVKAIRAGLPRGLGPIGDQITRATQSVCLNDGYAARGINRVMPRAGLCRVGDLVAGS